MSRFKFGDMVEHKEHGVGVVTSVRTYPGGMVYLDLVFDDHTQTTGVPGDLTPYTPPAPEGTVPVRIAVAVDSEGNAAARIIGKNDDENRAREEVAEDLLDGQPGFCRVSVLKGDMPLPQPPAEVRGEVEGC